MCKIVENNFLLFSSIAPISSTVAIGFDLSWLVMENEGSQVSLYSPLYKGSLPMEKPIR